MKSENSGMKTFDTALFELFMAGKVSEEEALRNADAPNNVRLKIKFAREQGGSAPPPGPMASPAAAPSAEGAAVSKPPPTFGQGMDLSLELVEEEDDGEERIF